MFCTQHLKVANQGFGAVTGVAATAAVKQLKLFSSRHLGDQLESARLRGQHCKGIALGLQGHQG